MSKFSVGVDFSKPCRVALEHEQLGIVYSKDGKPGWLLIKSDKHPDLIRLENKEKAEAVVRANAERRGQKEDVKLAEIEGKSLNYLVTALVDWGVGEGDDAVGGKLLNLAGEVFDAPCNDENKKAILDDTDWRFFRRCLDKAIIADKVFMPNSRHYSALTPNGSLNSEPSMKAESPSAST